MRKSESFLATFGPKLWSITLFVHARYGAMKVLCTGLVECGGVFGSKFKSSGHPGKVKRRWDRFNVASANQIASFNVALTLHRYKNLVGQRDAHFEGNPAAKKKNDLRCIGTDTQPPYTSPAGRLAA